MTFLDFLKVKIYENMLQNATNCTIKYIFFGEACPRSPLARAWPRHASQAPPPLKKKIVGPRWQILHTPMNYVQYY